MTPSRASALALALALILAAGCADDATTPDADVGPDGSIDAAAGDGTSRPGCDKPFSPPHCDVNLDGKINATDVAIIKASMGRRTSFFSGDCNDDDVVDSADLALANLQLGTDCTAQLPLTYLDARQRVAAKLLDTAPKREFTLYSDGLFTISELGHFAGAADTIAADHRDTITWFPCSWADPGSRHASQTNTGDWPKDKNGKLIPTECAKVKVPLDWDKPAGKTITLFLKHQGTACQRTTGTSCGKSIWFLQGGPAGAGTAFAGKAHLVADPTMEAYHLDMRGTGRSSYLACPTQEAGGSPGGAMITDDEWPACAASLDKAYLAHFSTTNQARDLGYLIDTVRALKQQVFTKGGSYGTYWTQRYLQIYPEQASGAIMTGVASAGPAASGGLNFANYMKQYEEIVGRQLEQRCADHAICSERLLGVPAKTKTGADVHAAMLSVLDNLGPGKGCPKITDPALSSVAGKYTRTVLKKWFATTILYATTSDWVLPFAVTYRLKRCNAGDVGALKAFASTISDFSSSMAASDMFSYVLNQHISLSEMWASPMTDVAAQAYADSCIWCFGRVTRFLNDPWPLAYPADAFVGKYADTLVPVLMLNGTLDPASPLVQSAYKVRDNLKSPHKHFFSLPDVAHAGVAPAPGGDCEARITAAFLADPATKPTDCSASVYPMNLGYDTHKSAFAGTTCGDGTQPCGYDAWRNYIYP
jgi:pimeloyl-ACP methyl ester carboxylesterase